MQGRSVRRRLNGLNAPMVVLLRDDDDSKLLSKQNVLLKSFHRLGIFNRIAPMLRLTSTRWRTAIDSSTTKMSLKTASNFGNDTRVDALTRFSALTDLTLEKESAEPQADSLDVLRGLSHLSKLTLRGLSAYDVPFLMTSTLNHLPQLTTLDLEIPPDALWDGMHSISHILGLRSLTLRVCGDCMPSLSPNVWSQYTDLTELSLSIRATGAALGLPGILSLVQLSSLRLSVPLLRSELADLSALHNLRSLVLCGLPFEVTNYNELSHMTQLTRLELPLIYRLLPPFLKKFTELKCLSLSWELSSKPGFLVPGFLPQTLTCLTLHNFGTPIRKDIMEPLTALKKLSLTQQTNRETGVGDQAAFQSLNAIFELFLSVNAVDYQPCLPSLQHMHCLKSLFLETTEEIDSNYITTLAKELRHLEHLTIGTLKNSDVTALINIRSLKSLTLLRCAQLELRLLYSLGRLEHLTDLCLYDCGIDLLLEDLMINIMEHFKSLEYFGFSPVHTLQKHGLPTWYEHRNRVVKIDDKCKLRVYFDGSLETVTYL